MGLWTTSNGEWRWLTYLYDSATVCQTQPLRLQFVTAVFSSLETGTKNFLKPFIRLLAESYIYARNVNYSNKYAYSPENKSQRIQDRNCADVKIKGQKHADISFTSGGTFHYEILSPEQLIKHSAFMFWEVFDIIFHQNGQIFCQAIEFYIITLSLLTEQIHQYW